ncbi:hypothetical protein J6590_017102 [Homalodisca vitripennis]|nr:hypothetical protein J6590_017102 [Homalodisca vitripennis]
MSDVLGSSGIEVDTQEAAGEGGLEGCTATGDRPESDETPGASAGAPTTAAGNLSPVCEGARAFEIGLRMKSEKPAPVSDQRQSLGVERRPDEASVQPQLSCRKAPTSPSG